MPFDAFISYSRNDKAAADATCAALEAAGIRCWIAPRDILPGGDWGESIIDAIASAKVMILIFSGHANGSPQIKREVERAVSKSVPIIPFRIEDVVPSKSLEYFLSTPHWLDAYTPPLERHFKQLAVAIQALSQISPADPATNPQPVHRQAATGEAARIGGAQRRRPFVWNWRLTAAAVAIVAVGGLAYWAYRAGPELYARIAAQPDTRTTVAPTPPLVSQLDPCAAAADHWRSAEVIGTVAAYEDHIARFDKCAFASLARARVEGKKEEERRRLANATPVQDPDRRTPSGDRLEAWRTLANSNVANDGEPVTFECPAHDSPNLLERAVVWGTDIYTADSELCPAAVHAGVITPQLGGAVKVVFNSGQSSHQGSTRNGVTTRAYGSYPRSFRFVRAAATQAEATDAWGALANSKLANDGVLVTFECPANATFDLQKTRTIWGTDTYTADSPVCPAAVHAGVITLQAGGPVRIMFVSGQSSHVGSVRNGVTTHQFGPYPRSFRLMTQADDAEAWRAQANSRPAREGEPITFACPGNATPDLLRARTIWGTDIYTADSPVCPAAMHMGLISTDGGIVTIVLGGRLSSYRGTTRNGITTESYGHYSGGSFTFVRADGTALMVPDVEKASKLRPRDQAARKPGDRFDYTCPPGVTLGQVWGSDVYTDDSMVCSAAIHAGLIKQDSGGTVTVQIGPDRLSYVGSQRNGVRSSNFGNFQYSYTFVGPARPVPSALNLGRAYAPQRATGPVASGQ